MGTLCGLVRDDLLLDLALEYKLPFRCAAELAEISGHSFPDYDKQAIERFLSKVESKGLCVLDRVLTPDFWVIGEDSYERLKEEVMDLLNEEVEGLSEFFIHPMLNTPEARAFNPTWQRRVWEGEVIKDPDVRRLIKERGIELVSYKFVADRCRF